MEITFSDLIGKVMLVGITYYTHDDQLIERKQFYGNVIRSDEKCIVIRMKNGEDLSIPPDLRSTKIAPPGEYRLHSTGEIVVNPDFTSMWNCTKAKPEDSIKE